MNIALLGNPNTGKSSVFNMLTGLRQQIGNFPGVTVEQRSGSLFVNGQTHNLIDFPGTYSLYPHSHDENIVYQVLSEPQHPSYPDHVIFVADSSNLERNLLFFSQLYDIGFSCTLVLNMSDIAQRKGIHLSSEALQAQFPEAQLVHTNARVALGKQRLLEAIAQPIKRSGHRFLRDGVIDLSDTLSQKADAEARLERIRSLQFVQLKKEETNKPSWSRKLDHFVVHPFWGYLLFAVLLLTVFQFIFAFASIPMDLIESGFVSLSNFVKSKMAAGLLNDLIAQGIIPGIGGVVVFIPHIAILFFFISILEESGYLARVVFIMDRLMRPFGLNGKSVVPLMSSMACAIPGILATRTIPNWKERMITILIAPFMSCSARIPVYTLLISLVIPNVYVGGFIQLQGLVLFALYALGVIFAMLSAVALNWLLKQKSKGFHLMELPDYKAPRWGNVAINVYEKVRIFVSDAGKIIFALSILLWALATFSPENKQFDTPEQQLEHSYIGIFGKSIEPAIAPLGYDWKIGVSLLTSFAAREVFVGSLATIYAVTDGDDAQQRLMQRMKHDQKADGSPVFTLATGLSLMVFYVFAMQCMATFAVVKRETNSWRWPFIQLFFMGALAYVAALFTFHFFS
ncbi:MAG: ferrous iron transport protein [Bacteroidota bacterium]